MTNEGPESTDRPDRPADSDDRPTASPSGPPPSAPPFGPGATDAYGQTAARSAPPTATYPAYAEPAPRPQDGALKARRRFAAGVIAAALVVGGGAGIGGAAIWDAVQGDDGASATTGLSTTQARSTSSSVQQAADGSIEAVAQKVLPSVVKIDVAGQQGAGSGSGIILSADGRILTNNHVVELAGTDGQIKVFFNDGSSADATIVGTDPLTDTALIQATGVSGLTPATIGTSGDLQVGQGVVAVGSPFGLESTVTSGIVSALNRPVDVGTTEDGTSSTTYPAIQTDAAINPGNSGGPLVDMAGNVVGIDSSIRTAGSTSSDEESGSIGLGFAIPIDEVLPIVDQMASGQTPTHARMGVKVGAVGGTQQQQDQTTLPSAEGAQVVDVTAGSTAAGAGIKSGDIITKVDDEIITDQDSLVATIRSYRPGDKATVTWTRDGKSQSATLTLDSDAATATS